MGVVRFDVVPALGGQSGDVLFDDLDGKTEGSHNKEEEALEELISRIVKKVVSN